MVAYERKIAQNDRLLVIRIRNLIHELRLTLEFLDSLLELSLERSEHPADERFSRDIAFTVLQVHELEVHRSNLGSAAMQRHFEFLLIDNLLEPCLVEILRRIHINSDNERAGKLGLQTIYLLFSQTHLQTEIVQVELVIHVLCPDSHHLDTVRSGRIRSIHTELGRSEHAFLNLFGSRN